MEHLKEGKRGMYRKYTHEVKLFTDKDEMILYVNSLTMIENVEVFKIEDNLYKVHVVRKNMDNQKEKDHECCHGEGHRHEKDHECCHGEGHKHDHRHDHECCKDKK